jgi:penicillin V acylase-like amidase (Ntn superfamily)
MCTTFTIRKQDSLLLGQNYDFYYGHGLIVASPRGLKKESLRAEGKKEIVWTSKYGNVTFTQFGRELPMGGMNEEGLTIAMMFHEDGQYPDDDGRPMLNELQWIQYQLDQYASVEEVVMNLSNIRLEKSMYELHYTLADSSGHTAIIEFVDGVAKVFEDAPYFAITNTSFEKSLQYANQSKELPITQLSRKLTSLDRFTLAYRLVESKSNLKRNSPNSPVDEAFSILHEVSVKPSIRSVWNWIGKKIPPTFTYWSIVFDVTNRAIQYRDYRNKKIRSFELRNFNFSKAEPALSLRLDNSLTGEIEAAFEPYTTKENMRIIQISYKPVTHIFSQEEQLELSRYPETFV